MTTFLAPPMVCAEAAPDRPAMPSALRRAWAALRQRVRDRQGLEQARCLSDHLLRDVAVRRADLELKAMYWPIWPSGGRNGA